MTRDVALVFGREVRSPFEVAITPSVALVISDSLDELIREISMRFELLLELQPWLRAGEDTLRDLDGLTE